ncbi:hypothetical protein [Streptomyces hainanensis]|nr:hypothetical protein [Streptomyces hainanensis]
MRSPASPARALWRGRNALAVELGDERRRDSLRHCVTADTT